MRNLGGWKPPTSGKTAPASNHGSPVVNLRFGADPRNEPVSCDHPGPPRVPARAIAELAGPPPTSDPATGNADGA